MTFWFPPFFSVSKLTIFCNFFHCEKTTYFITLLWKNFPPEASAKAQKKAHPKTKTPTLECWATHPKANLQPYCWVFFLPPLRLFIGPNEDDAWQRHLAADQPQTTKSNKIRVRDVCGSQRAKPKIQRNSSGEAWRCEWDACGHSEGTTTLKE